MDGRVVVDPDLKVRVEEEYPDDVGERWLELA
jgi:hypothetical protein